MAYVTSAHLHAAIVNAAEWQRRAEQAENAYRDRLIEACSLVSTPHPVQRVWCLEAEREYLRFAGFAAQATAQVHHLRSLQARQMEAQAVREARTAYPGLLQQLVDVLLAWSPICLRGK